MAYDVNTDYTAKNAELQKALAAATDAATKAAIQAQITANQSSREEKIASDLTTYGKYANDSELNNAAGIIANNQLGTGYEIQKTNLNTQFDNAKQNANNDALSRGMARSSFVSDRMANLDTSRANALTQVDASKALALQNAKTNILDNYRTNTANALANEKTEFANTIGAYSQDYQAEINKVQGNNDASDDWKIPYLQQARNEKIAAQEAAALKAASGGSYSGNGGGTKTATMSYSQLNTALGKIIDDQDETAAYNFLMANGGQYTDQLMAIYGLSDFAPAPKAPTTVLNDAAASYQVGMNRTAQGQKATIDRLYDSGQITEAQANALYDKFKIDG